MDLTKLQRYMRYTGKTEEQAVTELAEVGCMLLDRSTAPSHVSLPERFQQYIDECCDDGDKAAVKEFAIALVKKIDKEIGDCAEYNDKNKTLSVQDEIAMLAAFETVKHFINELAPDLDIF